MKLRYEKKYGEDLFGLFMDKCKGLKVLSSETYTYMTETGDIVDRFLLKGEAWGFFEQIPLVRNIT
jgi:hypothetical protein